jgi:hypothetical protein
MSAGRQRTPIPPATLRYEGELVGSGNLLCEPQEWRFDTVPFLPRRLETLRTDVFMERDACSGHSSVFCLDLIPHEHRQYSPALTPHPDALRGS